jgi:hypothetical protein
MRNGVKVYDCDTQLRPTVETIIPLSVLHLSPCTFHGCTFHGSDRAKSQRFQ